MGKTRRFYKNIPLRIYIRSIVKNEEDAEFLYCKLIEIFSREYKDCEITDAIIEEILNRDKIKKIIKGEYKKRVKQEWFYKKIPLKEYLSSLLDNQSDLEYLYNKTIRVLAKEYKQDMDLDELITDVLSRDNFKKIIAGTYVKQEKQIWVYKGRPLKEYLANIVVNPNDLEYLYDSVRSILDREYTSGVILDELIDDVLNRDRIRLIILGEYEKTTEVYWYFEGMPLREYIRKNITSLYRDDLQIYKLITINVSRKIKSNNFSVQKREELIKEFLASDKFKNALANPPIERLEYIYNNESLRQYLMKKVVDKKNLRYIYSFITSRISRIYKSQNNRDLNDIVNEVMISDEIIRLINSPSIERVEYEIWPCKDGLLIDYLRTIDLNGKDVSLVYCQVKDYIKSKYPEGFEQLDDKRLAIEDYINSSYFANYLKYGHTKRINYYQNMSLIDYFRTYYAEDLKRVGKTPENLYDKVTRDLLSYNLPEDLEIEEREQFIDDILRSDEIRAYLKKNKMTFEDWSYDNRELKEVVREKYANVIDEDIDLLRINNVILARARRKKNMNPDMSNKAILDEFFTDEYILSYEEEYRKRKKYRKDVKDKQRLFENKDDFDYISIYALENNLDIEKIREIAGKGFNYYAAIIMMDYANQENIDIDEVVAYSLNDTDTEEYWLWRFKLGYKEDLEKVIDKNRRLIYLWIYKQISSVLGNQEDIKGRVVEIFDYIIKTLMARFIIITCPIRGLFQSFRLFVLSTIKIYLLEFRREKSKDVDLEKLTFEPFLSKTNIEEDYLQKEEMEIINNALNGLSDLEQEFIDLRYGFTGDTHNLYEIKKIFEAKNIIMSIEELENMQNSILDSLKIREDVASLALNYQGD